MRAGRAIAALAATAAVLAAPGTASATSRADELELQHAFGAGAWGPRGKLTLSVDMEQKKISLKFDSPTYEFGAEELAAFKEQVGNDGFYRVRLRSSSEEEGWMVASIPACSLVASRFRENFRFHIDKNGSLLGLDYLPQVNTKDCSTADLGAVKLLSKASASLPQDALSIPKNTVALTGAGQVTAAKIASATAAAANGEAPPADEEEGEKEPEQSYIRKYWYILLPVALMIMSGPAEEAAPAGAAPAGAKGGASGGKGGKKKN